MKLFSTVRKKAVLRNSKRCLIIFALHSWTMDFLTLDTWDITSLGVISSRMVQLWKSILIVSVSNMEWSLLFPSTIVLHIDSDVSDHLPILLKCSPPSNEKGPRKKRFMFENMWLTESSSAEVITPAWSSVSNPNPVENSLLRLNKCAAALSQWNQTTFGTVGQEIKTLEHQLLSQTDVISQRSTLSLIRNWCKKEEILWWQRARSNYLKFGDSNARWFHSEANI